jgi:hypothetical protein
MLPWKRASLPSRTSQHQSLNLLRQFVGQVYDLPSSALGIEVDTLPAPVAALLLFVGQVSDLPSSAQGD